MSSAGPGLASTSPPRATWPSARGFAVAAAVAAAVLAGASTGSAVVAAILLGAATVDRRSGVAAVLAVLATSVRFRTAGFDDLAGIQSVLGAAGTVGPPLAAASAWTGAAAVVLAGRAPALPGGRDLPWRFAPALPAGLLAAALVAGPGPSDLALRIGASTAGVALACGVTLVAGRGRLARARPWLAVLAGVAAVVLAGWPA